MGSTPEGRIQAAIQKRMRERGVFLFKVHGSQMMPAGLPDLIGCVYGAFLSFEVKTPQTLGNVSAIQKFQHDRIRAAGGMVAVVASVEDAERALDTLLASMGKGSK